MRRPWLLLLTLAVAVPGTAVGDTMLGNTPDLPDHAEKYLDLVSDALEDPITGILRVSVGPKGWFRTGRFVSVKLNDEGRPSHDYTRRAAHLVARLSREDFGSSAPAISDTGSIGRPR